MRVTTTQLTYTVANLWNKQLYIEEQIRIVVYIKFSRNYIRIQVLQQ